MKFLSLFSCKFSNLNELILILIEKTIRADENLDVLPQATDNEESITRSVNHIESPYRKTTKSRWDRTNFRVIYISESIDGSIFNFQFSFLKNVYV